MNFDYYLEPPLESPGAADMDAHADRTELQLESFARTASRLSGRDVSIVVESYVGEDDEPLQDVTVTIRKLPMAEANDELLEVFRDLAAVILEAKRKERERAERKAKSTKLGNP